jgi:hypothetical protein
MPSQPVRNSGQAGQAGATKRFKAHRKDKPQAPRNDCREWPNLGVGPEAAANRRQFNNKAIGGSSLLFTTFGVWPGWCAGDMVTVQSKCVLLIIWVNDQPTACDRMDRAFWNEILFAGNLIPGFRETLRPQSRVLAARALEVLAAPFEAQGKRALEEKRKALTDDERSSSRRRVGKSVGAYNGAEEKP